MFKFMKSKKGFTLVELMIVVVIMAILVAVAVPIFSAVTKNARTKTCVSNMREIVSQITNKAMSENKTYLGTIEITSDGDKATAYTPTADANDKAGFATEFTETKFAGMFQAGIPVCPASGTYTITLTAADATTAGSVSVKVACEDNTDSETHAYGTTTAANP